MIRDAHSIEQFISEQADILNQSIGLVGISHTSMDKCTDIDIPESDVRSHRNDGLELLAPKLKLAYQLKKLVNTNIMTLCNTDSEEDEE